MSQQTTEVTAKDLMNPNLLTFSPEMTCKDALGILVSHHIYGGPVVDEHGVLVGVVSVHDFLKASLALPDKPAFIRQEQLQRLLEKGTLSPAEAITSMLDAYISDIMSTPAITIQPDTDKQTMIAILREKQIHRLIVIDKDSGKPLGLVSSFDLMS